MVVVGADVPKRTHTFVAADEVVRHVVQRTVSATSELHAKTLAWARSEFGVDLSWAIEDCHHVSERLKRDLLSAAQQVVRAPTMMMAEQRRVVRARGKSDPIDALPMARAFLREPSLQLATHDAVSRDAKLLADRREPLANTRTRTLNSLLWRVHELDPDHGPKDRSLGLITHQQALRAWLLTLEGVVAEMALDELEDIIALTVRIKEVERRIRALTRREVPGPARSDRLRRVIGAQTVGRVRRDHPVPLTGHVRPCPYAGHPRTRVYEKKLAGGKAKTEPPALPQTTPRARRRPPPHHRPYQPSNDCPPGSGLPKEKP